jgi:antirestriction protein ArdC
MTASNEKVWTPIIESMITSLEESKVTGVWNRPWIAGQHTNAATLAPYRSLNALVLSFAAIKMTDATPVWATYQQWKSLGCVVRAGSKGTALWTPPRYINKDQDDGSKVKVYLHPAIFYVFNSCQVDGYTEPEKLSEAQRLVDAEFFLHKHNPNIVFGDPTSAYYSPSLDVINMPQFDQFKTPEGYYSTLAHELVHWTGHKSRLDRKLTGQFGSASYAEEELIAEFGSAMICATLGLESATRDDHLVYLDGWLTRIRQEPDIIRKSVVQAAQAFNYIDRKQMQTEEQE